MTRHLIAAATVATAASVAGLALGAAVDAWARAGAVLAAADSNAHAEVAGALLALTLLALHPAIGVIQTYFLKTVPAGARRAGPDRTALAGTREPTLRRGAGVGSPQQPVARKGAGSPARAATGRPGPHHALLAARCARVTQTPGREPVQPAAPPNTRPGRVYTFGGAL